MSRATWPRAPWGTPQQKSGLSASKEGGRAGACGDTKGPVQGPPWMAWVVAGGHAVLQAWHLGFPGTSEGPVF